jgi:hypothetical protein
LPPLRVASLSKPEHRAMSQRARSLAEELLDAAGRLAPEHRALEHEITRGWLARIGAGEVVAPGSDA